MEPAFLSPYLGPMMTFLLWILLAVLSLPLAILVLLLYPLVWLIALPFRLVGISVTAVLELIEAILRFPARLLRGAQA